MRSQVTTWYIHAVLAVLAPALVILVTGSYFAGLPTALLMFIWYWYHEVQDKKFHILKGDWTSPGPDGITPEVDRAGDLVGPWSVLATYLLLELARLVGTV